MAKTLVGIVSSKSSDKTIVVTVHERKSHPLYRKQYSRNSKFMAHDEENSAKLGDRVIISETRPLSARKRFKLDSIVEKSEIDAKSLEVAKSQDKGKKPSRVKAKQEDEVKKGDQS